MKKLPLAMAVGVLILAVAVVMPTLIDASNQTGQYNATLIEGETDDVTDHLRVMASEIDPNTDTVNVTVTDTGTSVSRVQELNETETYEYAHPSGNVSVTVQSLDTSNGGTARLGIVYSPYFGWGDGARVIMQNLGLVLALTAFIIIGAMLAGVSKL